MGLSTLDAKNLASKIRGFDCSPISKDILEEAFDLVILSVISIWDALTIASASRMGCSVLYTEDMQHNRTISGVKIINPFS